MTCTQVQENLPLMMGQHDQSDAEIQDLQEHLGVCLTCRRHLVEMQKVWHTLDQLQLASTGPLPPPPRVIDEDLASTRRVHQRRPRLVLVLLVITVALVAAMRIQRVDLDTSALGFALAFLTLTVMLILAGLRMGSLPPRLGWSLLFGGVSVFALSGFMSQQVVVPNFPDSECLLAMLKLSFPGAVLMVAGGWGVRLPTPLSGALLGMGAGFVGATVLHLHCAITTWNHVLMFHGLGLLLMTGVGALMAWGVLRRNMRLG